MPAVLRYFGNVAALNSSRAFARRLRSSKGAVNIIQTDNVLPDAASAIRNDLRFQSFFMGGFECTTHVRRDGRRLDVLAATHHDTHTAIDYELMKQVGIRTVREGLRWNHIEAARGVYDWSSFMPMLRAAHETGTEVLWDVCHWGVPDWLDLFSSGFARHFEQYAAAAAEVIATERMRAGMTGAVYFCPINEISFWSWAGGDVAYMAPLCRGRGPELKRQLAHATICATRAIRRVLPDARFVQAEPLIHIAAATRRQTTLEKVRMHNAAQFEAWDMIAGRLQPELGGSEDLLDILGVNYYWNNQWVHCGERTPLGHRSHVPLHKLLLQVQERYNRPMLVTETGAEGDAAPGWLGMIGAEVRQAQAMGASIRGLCLYPVSDYPGWDDNRHVPCGLIALGRGYRRRALRLELAAELQAQRQILDMAARRSDI